jgi:hypothetical protein
MQWKLTFIWWMAECCVRTRSAATKQRQQAGWKPPYIVTSWHHWSLLYKPSVLSTLFTSISKVVIKPVDCQRQYADPPTAARPAIYAMPFKLMYGTVRYGSPMYFDETSNLPTVQYLLRTYAQHNITYPWWLSDACLHPPPPASCSFGWILLSS